MPPAAATIGRVLGALGRAAGADGTGEDGVPSSREAIFALVEGSSDPLTIDQICQASGLHANTVRAHLEVLHAAGRVERAPGSPKGRGRPPWLYSVAADERSPRARLAESLLDQLDAAVDPELARAAAERWADTLRRDAEPHTPAVDPDDAVQRVATELEHLGFDARVDGIGDRIELRACPYAALVADRPAICEIHAALLEELLDHSGKPVGLRSLDVWTRPGVCVAHLTRPDLRPARSISGSGVVGQASLPHDPTSHSPATPRSTRA